MILKAVKISAQPAMLPRRIRNQDVSIVLAVCHRRHVPCPCGGGATVNILERVVELPEESVIVSVSMYVPADEYVWAVVCPERVTPSPKLQEYV